MDRVDNMNKNRQPDRRNSKINGNSNNSFPEKLSITSKNQPSFTYGRGERPISTQYPELESQKRLVEFGGYSSKKFFPPHWSMEAVNDALEKGDAFRASYHVNGYNKTEAYCTIDGVPIDALVKGFDHQNRAVHGDIVAIKIDPVTLWTKLRGSVGSTVTSSEPDDDGSSVKLNGTSDGSAKSKNKTNADYDIGQHFNCLSLEIGCDNGNNSGETDHLDLIGSKGYHILNGYYPSNSMVKCVSPSNGVNNVGNSVERICALINKFPSKRPTGKIIAILEKSPCRNAIVGFLNIKQWLSFKDCHRKHIENKNRLVISDHEYIQLTPNDPKIRKMNVLVNSLPDSIRKRLEDGDVTVEAELVVAKLEYWGNEHIIPKASVLHVLGRGDEKEPQLQAILFEQGIRKSEFSPESISCLPSIPWEVPQEEYERRKDIRNICSFTIDPTSAIDLDDALSIERLPNGVFRVGVHIADVSYFVSPGTALDSEAQARSTSVYTLEGKLPMLPYLLSENMVSLNPGVDRLAFSIFWDINNTGDIINRWVGHAVIKSCCKLSYDDAQAIINGMTNPEISNGLEKNQPQLHGCFQWNDVVESVKILYEISKTLKKKRFSDGALQFEDSEIVFLYDESWNPYDFMLSKSRESDYLIEEFMLLANVTAAEIISRAYPACALLRRHPKPNKWRLEEFRNFCCKYGLELDTSSIIQFHQSLERIREKLKDDPMMVHIINDYANKPMECASYFCTGKNENKNDWAHYALATPLYTHFTSPLRRYPDLIVHRTLAATLEADELYQKHRRTLHRVKKMESSARCFTGINFDRDAAESVEGKVALSTAALKHRVPCAKILADVAAYCNQRTRASRNVEYACEKLCMWILLKRRKVIFSEAKVLDLGPNYMIVYICELSVERQLYYDRVEGLDVEWLESTCTVVLSLNKDKHVYKKRNQSRYKALEDVAFVNPQDPKIEPKCQVRHFDVDVSDGAQLESVSVPGHASSKIDIDPAIFPITMRLLSTIPVALHAVGGDDGPLDIGVRLFISLDFM